jgi:altronate hydrolase
VNVPVLVVHPSDSVAVALRPLTVGESVDGIVVREPIDAGHKIARRAIAAGESVIKYGFPIGVATEAIAVGSWVHAQNLRTGLSGATAYRYEQRATSDAAPLATTGAATFRGYRRSSGRVGTRNEVWIINTVGCVNTAAERIAREASTRYAGMVDGVYAFSHPYGCSQLGDDLGNTQAVLAGLMRHPNAGGVLVLGLGCENNQMASLLKAAGALDPDRLRYFNTQDVSDEIEEGVVAVGELVATMTRDRREAAPLSDLVLGMKCGGSDGFSGLSANPLVGRIADRVTAAGGRVVLTEVPEMFGAEQVLIDRAADEPTARAIGAMVNDFKQYFERHGQPVYENPSPGNKAGGITTLEEKSLGAIQKGGSATVTDVLRYGAPITKPGLSLLEAPGNDGVSATAMTASGATLLLFTTGRGTPLGFPVPTVKIASNHAIAEKKPHWIDVDAGAVLDGTTTLDALADTLLTQVIAIASGEAKTKNELSGNREIAIWKEGVTL